MTTQQCKSSDEAPGMSAAMEALTLMAIILAPNVIAISYLAWWA